MKSEVDIEQNPFVDRFQRKTLATKKDGNELWMALD
jgi:hypothetical protein